jgi:dihydroorotate dehydrogenase
MSYPALAVIYHIDPDLPEAEALQAAYLLNNAQQQGIKVTETLVERIIFDVTRPLHRWQ